MTLLDDTYASFINLDSRPDRRKRMEETLRAVGISAVRTRGRLPEEYTGNPSRVRVMQNRTPGAIGCYMSQVEVITDAWDRAQHALVMEDDLVFCADFHERLVIIDDFVSTRPWDVIWLGGTFHVNPAVWHRDTLGRDAALTDNMRMVRTFGAFSTHCYLVNRASCSRVLWELDRMLDVSMGIDWSFIQLEPSLQTFAFVPGCVIQYDNRSNIGRGMTMFSNFKKLGPHWFQPLMSDFDPRTYDWGEAGR